MQFEWDEEKRKANADKHGLDFADLTSFEMITAFLVEDDRRDYGEIRWFGIGLLKAMVVAVVYTERDGKVRVISLRKANRKEATIYVENI